MALFGSLLLLFNYDTAYPEFKLDFIAKLHDIWNMLPTLFSSVGLLTWLGVIYKKVKTLLTHSSLSYLMIGSIRGSFGDFDFQRMLYLVK